MIPHTSHERRDYAAEEEGQARLLLSSVLFGLALLCLLFFMLPAYATMRASQARLVGLAILGDAEQEINNAYEEAHVRLVQHGPVLRRADIALPVLMQGEVSDVPELLATIEALVERDVGGIFIDELQVGTDAELMSRGDAFFWRPIRLSGLAGVGSIARLLDQVRGTLHLIEPVHLTMEPAGEDVVQFTLMLERAVLRPHQ